jgi:galactokinase
MFKNVSTPHRDSTTVLELFKKHFGYRPPHVVQCPARLELIGNHTGVADGLVISVAVDRHMFMACAPRSDGRIELISSLSPQPEKFWITELTRNPAAPWADRVKSMLAQLRKRGVHFNGFNAAISGNIPPAVGMGGSTALLIATALAVRQLHPFSLGETGATLPPRRDDRGRIPPLAVAQKTHFSRLIQAAETDFSGAPAGLLNPMTALVGKAWHALAFDCRSQSVDHLPFIGEVIVLCDSGARCVPASAELEELRSCCNSAARALGAKSLRAVEMKQLQTGRSRLTLREYECAAHVVGEIARVVAGERALREDDHRQFGQYLFQSHESSRDLLRNSTAALDTLVEIAKKHPGCLGARLAGHGFGGATINLVSHHQAASFAAHMRECHEKATGLKIEPMICQMVDGAE